MEGPKSNNAYTSKSSDEDPEQYGIILRAAKQISDHVKERMSQPPDAGKEKMEYIMKASYMEIYQEQLTDLLVDKNEQGKE